MKTTEIIYRSNLKRFHDIVGNEPFFVKEKMSDDDVFNPKNEVYLKPIINNKSGCRLYKYVDTKLRHNHFLNLN